MALSLEAASIVAALDVGLRAKLDIVSAEVREMQHKQVVMTGYISEISQRVERNGVDMLAF
jgi:hypothetical protein